MYIEHCLKSNDVFLKYTWYSGEQAIDLQAHGTPSRLYSAADLEAGPAMQQNASEHKQMDAFFSEVTVIRVTIDGRYSAQQ